MKFKKYTIIFIILIFIISQIILPITIVTNPNIQYLYKTELIKKKKKENQNQWNIKIPSINLIAPISDGTEAETLNKYVGHFKISGYILGNIALAAHNRGYSVNYFENLKYLQIGDKIIYEYKALKLTYQVSSIKIIKDTNIEVVYNSKQNKITLITCVENQPEKRRCIQGKLII